MSFNPRLPKRIDMLNGLLGRYVKQIWTLDSGSGGNLKFFADGCPGIMFQQGDGPMTLNSSRKPASVFLYGQTVAPISLSTNGSYNAVAAMLEPDAIDALFGIRASEVTNSCIDLSLLPSGSGFRLMEQLVDVSDNSSRVEVMEKFILQILLKRQPQPNTGIKHAIKLIQESGGNKRIADLSRELGVSERTLARNFEAKVGVTPKLFSSICQFQTAAERIRSAAFESLTGLAYDLGYSDQSHFNRWFKFFTGETPLQYLRHQHRGCDAVPRQHIPGTIITQALSI